MSLKRTLLDLLPADQLKELCIELEVEGDRRSREGMVAALAVAMLVNATESTGNDGLSQEQVVLAPGAARTRSTRMVNFHTGKPLHEVTRCHLNAAVFDSDWERQAAELLGVHAVVQSWVKNDRLGLVIPYRKEGVARKYLPDFVVELVSGEMLFVEIKGQIGDAMIKKAAAERWCGAVSNAGRLGRWSTGSA